MNDIKNLILPFAIISVFATTVIAIKQEYILTKEERIVCDAVLAHTYEFYDSLSIKVTGGMYDVDNGIVLVNITSKNRVGATVSSPFCIYGENFENMVNLELIVNLDDSVLQLCNKQDGLDFRRINNAIYREVRK